MHFIKLQKQKKFHFIYDDNNAKKLESFIHYSLTNDPNVVFDSEYYWSYNNLKRDDPILVQVVETLGEKANGKFAKLKIEELNDNDEFAISEYDGNETIEIVLEGVVEKLKEELAQWKHDALVAQKLYHELLNNSVKLIEALKRHNIEICNGSCAFDNKKLNEILEKGKQS